MSSIRETADRVVAECTDSTGRVFVARAISAIEAVLNAERERAFDQGYVCAVANIMNLHGEEVIAREVLNQNRPKDWSIIDAGDMRALQPIFDHEAAQAEMRKP